MTPDEHSLASCVEAYAGLVAQGDIARAYRAIVSALSQFKSAWEATHPADTGGALYQGYLDMSFVSISPAALSKQRLKISLVFLHDTGTFSLWLVAGNRAIQKNVSEALHTVPLGHYRLTMLGPGIDAIIEQPLPKPYAFDAPETLTATLVRAMECFTVDVIALVNRISG